MRSKLLLLALLLALTFLVVNRVLPDMTMNGFDLGDALIPVEMIKHGGPPRDGIPSIDKPRFIPPDKADYLKSDDRILGVNFRGVARAYPVRIMDWHEIVNDEYAGEAVIVTYCPLCGTGMAFLPEAPAIKFGVSGLLYNSDVLLYDRETESLWSQIMGQAVSGPQSGKKLKQIVMSHTTWKDWLQRYPGTTVLSTETGYQRDYESSPYLDYTGTSKIWFPVSAKDDRYPSKEWVLGVTVNGVQKAYPFSELARAGKKIQDRVGGVDLVVQYDQENSTAHLYDAEGKALSATMSYWFAWFAFYPDTLVFSSQ